MTSAILARSLAVAIAAIVTAVACGARKPVVFNHVHGQADENDKLVHQLFGDRYRVIDVTSGFSAPRGIQGSPPGEPIGVNGKCLAGEVTVFYIVTVEGVPVSAHVVAATDHVLSSAAVERMSTWKFEPARVNDMYVAAVIGSHFRSRCPD